MHDRLSALALLLPKVEGQPHAMVSLARQFRAVGEEAQALDLASRALALAPGDGEVRTAAHELLSDGVPDWHFVIVRDEMRNQAYDEALRRAVTPRSRVLEIGTGSGLLAMMAARAGAADVVTIEANPPVAAAARAVIAANGLADRVRVIAKHSTAVREEDLDGRFDILVSEIVSSDLLSQGVMPAHQDAMARLLTPDARVIPARGRIRVALAEDKSDRSERLDMVSGFDLGAMRRLTPPSTQLSLNSQRVTLRSDAGDLFGFDFACRDATPPLGERELVSRGGRVNGIVQWLALDMDDSDIYENHPEMAASSCWRMVFWPLAAPIDTNPGDRLVIMGRHETDRVRLWLK